MENREPEQWKLNLEAEAEKHTEDYDEQSIELRKRFKEMEMENIRKQQALVDGFKDSLANIEKEFAEEMEKSNIEINIDRLEELGHLKDEFQGKVDEAMEDLKAITARSTELSDKIEEIRHKLEEKKTAGK